MTPRAVVTLAALYTMPPTLRSHAMFNAYREGTYDRDVTLAERDALTAQMTPADAEGWPFEPYSWRDGAGVLWSFARIGEPARLASGPTPETDVFFAEFFNLENPK